MAADSDDGSQSQRESHYNQQRSSHPSTKSLRSRSGSRPQSEHRSKDFSLQDDAEVKPPPPLTPSPPPIVPRRKQSLDNGKSSSRSRRGSARSIPRTGSRNRNIDAILVPESWDQLKEIGAPAPIVPYRHSTVEEERTDSRGSRASGRSAQTRSIRSVLRLGGSDRRETPRSELDITALPMVPDTSGGNPQAVYSQEYVRSKATIRQQKASRFATDFYTISYLVFFAIWGTLARIGIQWLTFYPGAPVNFSNLWANFSGTLVMGFLVEDRRLFRAEWGHPAPTPPENPADDEENALEQFQITHDSHLKVKKTIPLYIGLATGFCGSFTSFSSFMRDVFFALSNNMPSPINHPTQDATSTASTNPRNGGYSFMAIWAVIIITIAVCWAALKLGAHLARTLDSFTPTLPFQFTRRILDPAIAFLAWGCWLGAVVMAVVPPDRPNGPESKGIWANETWRGQALFACVFAPLGCLLRYYVSLHLNSLIPTFPLGTFAVNVFGTAVLGMAFDLQHVSIGNTGVVGGTIVGCQVLQGLMDGFCGSLTTVSTWMTEIQALKRGYAYTYASASVAAGLAILVIVMGSVRWSVGWQAVSCVL